MKTSKELMDKAGIVPKLKLGIKKEGGGVESTGPHRVKMVSDKIVRGIDRDTGQEVEYVKYVVEENGEQKEYRTRLKSKETGELSYLVQNLSQVEEGTEVVLELKKAGMKNYVEVRSPEGETITDTEQDDVTEPTEDEDDIHADEPPH